MAFLLYGGAAVLAGSVVSSLATKAVTNSPYILANVLTRAGVLTSTTKESYRLYYKRMASAGPLFDAILTILAKNTDKSYGVRQDPRTYDNSLLGKITGPNTLDDGKVISADILCFRNNASFYDYSSFGRARVRFYYDGTSNPGQAVIMCQKKSELEDFCKLIVTPGFDSEKSLAFIGVG